MFQLDDRFQIELIASEPMVQDPVAMAFDEDGRIWVVEMRGFMPNVDGEGEDEPVGRITILTDTDTNGAMDRCQVFADGLVLPRAIAVVKGGALVADQRQLWFLRDTDGDGCSDAKEIVDPDYGGSGMPEHSPNGLWRGIDNWYYNAKSTSRFRVSNGQWIRDTTEFRGQWGICHDDYGRLFYNYNWSQLHADIAPPSYLSRNPNYQATTGISVGVATNQSIFPVRPNIAVNRGYVPGALDQNGKLREFTSAGAPLIYRGDAFPEAFAGNAFVCEPAGNLVKRNIVDGNELTLTSRFAYERNEFLASPDERFRPVFLSNGPDGALYVVDMYRGIIQHRAHMTAYLRTVSVERGMEQPIHFGRIYRIVPRDWTSPVIPRMSKAATEQLVDWLSHPNGWRRDTAQRLLVERADPKAIPLLRRVALHGEHHLGRLHALWTLEALSTNEAEDLLTALEDPHPEVQAAAIRVLELMASRRPELRRQLLEQLEKRLSTAALQVRFQIALSTGNVAQEGRLPILHRIISSDADSPLIRDAVISSLHGYEFPFLRRLWDDPNWDSEKPGRAFFFEALASAVVRSGIPQHTIALLESLQSGTPPLDWRRRAVLAGLALHADQRNIKPIQLDRAPALIAKLHTSDDRQIRVHADKLKRIFKWPGHNPAQSSVRTGRPLTASEADLYVQGRQLYLTTCAGCHGVDGAGLAPLGPPLLDSPWVLGPPERLARILLHGLEGPIEVGGKRYAPPDILPEMPALAILDNQSLAAVLTYIRRAWDHQASPVHPKTVSQIRVMTQGRLRPWTQEELDALGR